jgi:lysophospholipase L1-like esterase
MSVGVAGLALLSTLGLSGLGDAGTAVRVASASPKAYYLALGDSIAYGIQPAKAEAGLPPPGFRTGYVDVFARRLKQLAPNIRVVNYSCPGESTVTFVRGGCPWLIGGRKLHDPFRGSQMQAAIVFLAAHHGQVSPITVHLWGNDIDLEAEACKGDFACIKKRAPVAIARIASRLGEILRRLRAAAPAAEIIVNGTWNLNADDLARTDPLFRSLDLAIRHAAGRAKARFADVFPLFNPQGNITRERARICALTFICKRDDPHPTDAGYRAIATAVRQASGY